MPVPCSGRAGEGKWGGPGLRVLTSVADVRKCRSDTETAFITPYRYAARPGKGGFPPSHTPLFFAGIAYFAPAKLFSPGTPYTPARVEQLVSGPLSSGPPQNRMILWGESEQGGLPCTRLRLRAALCGGAEKKLHFCLFRLAPTATLALRLEQGLCPSHPGRSCVGARGSIAGDFEPHPTKSAILRGPRECLHFVQGAEVTFCLNGTCGDKRAPVKKEPARRLVSRQGS